MGTIYFKVQTENEAIPLFKTIKEVGNHDTILNGDATSSAVYEIYYEDTSFEILNVDIHANEPLGVPCRSLSKCEFIHLPIEIQKEMVNRSSSKSIIPFLCDVTADHYTGGFDWESTPEGRSFWEDIIIRKQFNLFFKSKDNKTNFKQQQNEDENQLQKEGIPRSGGNEPITTGVLCRRRKARITVKHLGHQKIVGRG